MSFDFNVPIQKQSLIVGKQGATIKEISSKCNVSIKMPPREQLSTLVTIVGTEANANKAKLEIENAIGFKISSEVLVENSYSVPVERHGILIGPQGATIQNIQKTNNVILTIPKKETNTPSIQLLGTQSSIKSAVKEIEKLLGFSLSKPESKIQNHTSNKLEKLPLDDVNEVLFFGVGTKEDDAHFKKFLQYLGSPKKTVDICVFTISDDTISNVILDLHKSGVEVRVITDDETSTNLGSDIKQLYQAGIPVRMDNSKAHMHHKFAILDGKCVINGSFNWTKAAHMENKENIVIASSSKLVKPFIDQFGSLWKEFEHNKITVS